MRTHLLRVLLPLIATGPVAAVADTGGDVKQAVQTLVTSEYPSLESIYRHLHANPELSLMEVNTAALVARELRSGGFEVTEKVGGTGVVAVLRNGPGPTVLVRADMDALPLKETSGVPYASTAIVKDFSGREQPAMHGCAHDSHVTSLIGTARVLAGLKARWSGTLVLIAQPAEEIFEGARAMLADGLYTRFPKPDFAIGLHTMAAYPAGTIAYNENAFMSGVSSVDVIVRGVGGHGSAPNTTKDSVVLAAQIVTALQTIVSRELKPGTPAVVTVGTIHGGLKRNIIPNEVKLELTVRAFDEAVMKQEVDAIRRICEGLARAAGVPDDRLPIVTLTPESGPPLINNAALTRRLVGVFQTWLGPERVKAVDPIAGAEDFTYYGRTAERVPIAFWFVGGTAPEKVAESERTAAPLPSNHSSGFVPETEPTLKTAITSLSAAVLELLPKA